MPTIPIAKEELERLKADVSLRRLIESQGHELVRRGKDWAMRCVFHEDATPSLVVTESKNLYHCFGCGAGGSVLDWVMKTQGVSLPHAVQLLKHGVPLDGNRVGVVRSSARPLPSLAEDAADDQVLLARVADYYHATLRDSSQGQAYLAGRGLNHPELIDRFRLGHANSTLMYRLPSKHSVAGKAVRAQLQRLGVTRRTGYEQLGGCIVVPVLGEDDDERGRVWQMYGRRTADAKMGRDEVRHLYLGAPLRGVWNASALAADREIIVCESLIDAMTFWCAGYRNVIAAYGVNGFTDDHRAALKRHGTQRVLIAYDRDDAGNAASEKLATELLETGIECFRVLFPKGMDANEYARKVTPAQKSLGLLLQQSEWLTYPFLIADEAIAGMGTIGKVAANGYNAGVGGVTAFGAAGVTHQDSPGISGGFGAGATALGSAVKSMFPGAFGNFLNNVIQGATGPVQTAVTQGGTGK